VDQILFGAEVPFRSLKRGVAQQQLDLLKLAAIGTTQLGARTAEIMMVIN
jgi:hypothetical protein